MTVTPNTTYYFDIVIQSGASLYVDVYNDFRYSGGQAYLLGNSGPLGDLWFREGIIQPTPEPSTFWLALLGGGVFWFWHRLKISGQQKT